MKRLIGVLLLTTACSVSQPSESKEDSVAVLSDENMDMVTEDQIGPVDTLFTNVVIEKKATRTVLDASTLYVYNKDGLDMTDASGTVVGHFDYKSKIDVKQITGNIDRDYLLPLPVPEGTDVVDYFTKTLMLTEDPVERRNPESLDDTDGMFSFIDYSFEGGYKVLSGSQYESGYTTVNLPGLSTKQAFVFASYFYESFPESFKEIPAEARDEDLPEEKHITVQVEGGKVINILVTNGQGCYWEDSVSASESGAVMNSSGGC